MTRLRDLAPGLALVAVATALAYAVNLLVPLLSALLVAIVLGVVLRNTGLIPAAAEPGVGFAAKKVLRAGVVLLGFQLSLPVVLDLGWGVIGVVVVTVALTFLGTLAAGRAMGLPRDHRLLVATGTSICGASAVAAMSAVLDGHRGDAADRREGDDGGLEDAAATSVAAVTLYGTIALVALPALAGVLGLGPDQAGAWIGSGVHEVGQVVAAGGLLGPDVLQTAVVTKLARVLMLAPIVLLVGLALARAARGAGRAVSDGGTGAAGSRPPLVPLFVVGFVVAVALRSVLGLPDAHPLPATVKLVTTVLLTAAMVGMGAGVKVRTLVATGGPILALSGIASLIVAVVSGVSVLLLV